MESPDEDFHEVKPYLRTFMAFSLLLRFGLKMQAAEAYEIVDPFLDQLERDLKA